MNIQQDILSSPIAVSFVDSGRIVVAGQRFETSVRFGSRLQPVAWPADETGSFAQAAEALIRHFSPLGGIILLGTGERLVFPPVEIRRLWAQAGLIVDVMDTAAACRTFNLLVGEGREAHAAVLLGIAW